MEVSRFFESSKGSKSKQGMGNIETFATLKPAKPAFGSCSGSGGTS
jgi:hypothetical protein